MNAKAALTFDPSISCASNQESAVNKVADNQTCFMSYTLDEAKASL